MSFFRVPPQPPEPPQPPRSLWDGPPNNVLGIVVPLNLLLAQSERAAVTLGSLIAYPTGFEFDYLIRSRDEELGQWLPEHIHRRRLQGASDALPAELFRFGIEFSDGARATSLEPALPFGQVDEHGPVMVPRGGGGSYERWLGHWWVWPLPPTGGVAFVCEWPAAGIDLTRSEIDADLIHAAAAQAKTLWEDSSSGGTPGAGYAVMQWVRAIQEPPA